MNTSTESTVAKALDAVIAPYQPALLMLTPGERILLAGELGHICRMVAVATEKASRERRGADGVDGTTR